MRHKPPLPLTRRAEFLHAAAHGKKLARPGYVIQLVRTTPGLPARVGFTASRKVGNAVARNRARRRLREMVRLSLPEMPVDGADLVLIARHDTAALDFAVLRESFTRTLARMLQR
jgi:ribonuclease P protein component